MRIIVKIGRLFKKFVSKLSQEGVYKSRILQLATVLTCLLPSEDSPLVYKLEKRWVLWEGQAQASPLSSVPF